MRFKDENYRKEKSNSHARLDCFSLLIKRVLSSVVAVAFQIIFGVEIHTNNVFLFLKIIFNTSISKQFKTYKPY